MLPRSPLTWLLVAALAWFGWQQYAPVEVSAQHAEGYRILALDDYAGEFRVLSAKTYRHGREAELSPVDLALGWGPMADPAVYRQLDIAQRHRWYFWNARTTALPLPRRSIETHSANVHIVPATPEIARELARVRAEDLVELRGKLIAVEGDDGWSWRSSLSRTDTGDGACELLLLEAIAWVGGSGA